MPYERVCLLVAMVVTVILSVLLSGNFAKEARVAVIDLDNSAYTRELITRVNASEYMKVTAVLNTPVDPKTLFYEDKAVFPAGARKGSLYGRRHADRRILRQHEQRADGRYQGGAQRAHRPR